MNIKTIILISSIIILGATALYIYSLPSNGGNNNNSNNNDSFFKNLFKSFNENNNDNNYVPDEFRSIDDFNVDNKSNYNVRSRGNKLLCDSLSEITSNKVIYDYEFNGGNDKFKVDCYDKENNIVLDYRPKEYYNFVGGESKKLMDYYKTIYNNKLKEELMNKHKIDYHKVPYLVDGCYKVEDDEYSCGEDLTDGIRKLRFQSYLKEVLSN